MDTSKLTDARILSDIPLKILVTRYIEEIGEQDGFGKNKQATLLSLRKYLGDILANNLTSDRIRTYAKLRQQGAPTQTILQVRQGERNAAGVILRKSYSI